MPYTNRIINLNLQRSHFSDLGRARRFEVEDTLYRWRGSAYDAKRAALTGIRGRNR